MPIYEVHQGSETYYQYGMDGAKYLFDESKKGSKEKAYKKAVKQSKAIHANSKK